MPWRAAEQETTNRSQIDPASEQNEGERRKQVGAGAAREMDLPAEDAVTYVR